VQHTDDEHGNLCGSAEQDVVVVLQKLVLVVWDVHV